MKRKNECGGLSQAKSGLSQGEIGLSQGEIGLSQGEIDCRSAITVCRRAKPACPARVPPPSGAPAALLRQPSIGTGINLRPQRIWRAAGFASTAPDRLQPEPAAATTTSTMWGAPGAAAEA